MGVPLTTGLTKLIDEAIRSGQGLASDLVEKLVGEIAKNFAVKGDEVALLNLTHNGSVLSFLYPFKLQKVGSIPMTSAASLAVRTVREKRPEMINNFPAQKHPTIFEAVELNVETKGSPIQKIMSAPIIVEGKSVGVIQVCRKGKTGPAAGADFTIKDLTTLMTSAGILAKAFKTTK